MWRWHEERAPKAERPTFSAARDALFRGDFEDCLAFCDALPERNVETDLLRARAFIALNRADRALDAVRRLRVRVEPTDESLTARMLEGAALLKFGQLDEGLAVLHAAHADARRAHPTIRAEIAVHVGIGHYREAQYPQALHHLRSVPDTADIVHARAILFEGWVLFDAGDVEIAAERFRDALRRIATCHQYDRFIEASASTGSPSFVPRFQNPHGGLKYATARTRSTGQRAGSLYRCSFSRQQRRTSRNFAANSTRRASGVRAQAVAPSPFYEIVATVRLAELVGRYGERLSHAYFVSSALARFEALQNDALLREDHTLPLTLAEELAQGSNPGNAAPLLSYYVQVIAPRTRGTKDEGMLARQRRSSKATWRKRQAGPRARANGIAQRWTGTTRWDIAGEPRWPHIALRC